MPRHSRSNKQRGERIVDHPNLGRLQQMWDSLAKGDPGPALELLSDDVVLEMGSRRATT